MWTYSQSSGVLSRNGVFVGKGYSGAFPDGYNKPAMQAVRDIGPIPQGAWKISGPPVDTSEHGPYVLTLSPKEGTDTFGRDGFLCHGDTIVPGHASQG